MSPSWSFAVSLRCPCECKQIGQRRGADLGSELDQLVEAGVAGGDGDHGQGVGARRLDVTRGIADHADARTVAGQFPGLARRMADQFGADGKRSLKPPKRNHSRKPASSILIQPIISRLPVATPSKAPRRAGGSGRLSRRA